MKKLKSRRGETLTETLASILIIALSAAILAGMVSAAARLSAKAKAADATFYQEIQAAEVGSPGEAGSGIVTITAGGDTGSVHVSVRGGGSALTSYRLEVEP